MDRTILIVARNSISEKFGLETQNVTINKDWLKKGASFVTLTRNNKLRGCIGSLNASRPLLTDIKYNAKHAAFNDPRFPALELKELPLIKIEVSVLSDLKELIFTTEDELIKQIIPKKMGLVLEYDLHRGTFLPQVWDVLPDKNEFLNNLKLKAGLNKNFYSSQMNFFYYEVEQCQE